ncbi:MAG TPA: UTP--glucose-1-phosphate uridylyltransferase GalU [Gammaproteobacteria bacterium]|nr:UTP--glucose-1-phosphate uridylyltransferase GalU [Gammaproteobacteria bacterium]
MSKITKAVFPVAGLGTRFLPATKATPKEMLPIVDKPLIQYAVEEAIQAGITEIIFVTSSLKRAIEDHFDSNYELENKLSKSNKTELLKIVKDILPKGVSTAYVRQPEALGLGHAVLCAEQLINKEPFAVLLADDLIEGEPGCLSQMVKAYEEHHASIIAVQEIPDSETERYGMVAIDAKHKINKIIEKPKKQDAPSNLGVVGRYILSPNIFSCLHKTAAGAGGEIQLTDAIALLLKTESAFALPFVGKRYDCGSKLGYLEATVQYALKHPELSQDFKNYLKNIKL